MVDGMADVVADGVADGVAKDTTEDRLAAPEVGRVCAPTGASPKPKTTGDKNSKTGIDWSFMPLFLCAPR
jgi:hypothetical protein